MAVNKKDLAPLSFPKVPPYKVIGEYLHSKNVKSLTKKYPEWDVARKNPEADLVVKTRDLYDVDQRLLAKRAEAVKKRKEIDGQWNDLEDKEKTLKENFMKFNKFVRENQEKRERAERKIADERALITKKDSEIKNLQERYEYMASIRSAMEKNIRSHRMYEDFLLVVVKICPSFRTPDDIVDRFETLAEARKVLADRQERDLTALEDARNEMGKITEEKSLAIMGLYNKMAELQNRYEVAKNKALQWEMMVTKIKNTSVEKLAELHSIRQSAWSMYLSMCKRKEIKPELAREDIENQLLFIKSTISELRRIARISQRRATKESFSRPDTRSTKR